MSATEPTRTSEGFEALSRLLRNPAKKPAPGEYCEFCTVLLEPQHSHLVDLQQRKLMCACRPCWLLFEPKGAAQGRYKCVPRRYEQLDGPALTEAQWDALQIPINLAFFFYNSPEQKMVAFYPGPAGATESLLPLSAWDNFVAAYPVLASLAGDVEACLIHRPREGGQRAFLVPIDACYELVGILRSNWKGFDGGEEAWSAIDGFFARLAAQAQGVQTSRTS